jgi:TatA/E family protein of Tat protein translocase
MFGIGFQELLVIFLIGLVVLGPKRFPEIARALGKGITQFLRALNAPDEPETKDDDSPAGKAEGDEKGAQGAEDQHPTSNSAESL